VESTQRGRNAFLTTAGILVLVAVVAIASRGSTSTGGPGARRPTDTLLDILLSLYLVGLVAGALLLLYMLALRRTIVSPAGGRGRRNWRSTIAMLVLVGAALLLARDYSGRRLEGRPPVLPEIGGGQGVTTTGPVAEYEADFAWIPVSITLGLLAVAVAGVWWSGRARRRARGERGVNPFADALAAAVDESLDDLHAEPDPRRAVIAAYARLERVLASHGLPRKPSEAPLEYLARMLGGLSVSPPAARRLTDLFERAKFSQHAVGPEMKEQAIGALETVRDDLAAARALAEAECEAALEAQRAGAAG
jgi:hypothetical protein